MCIRDRSYAPYTGILQEETAETISCVGQIGKDGMNRIINLLGKYAKTRWITITVEDLDGTPAAGAKVRAEVMNYGEFSPIAIMEADKNGCISFETGFGSLLICAVYDGAYGEKVIDTREDDHFTCTLGEEYEDELWVDFDMNAPVDTGRISSVSYTHLDVYKRQGEYRIL